MFDQIRLPDTIEIETEYGIEIPLVQGTYGKVGDIEIGFEFIGDKSIRIDMSADETPVKYLRLRWNNAHLGNEFRYMNDAFERTYADLYWADITFARRYPWYLLATDTDTTIGVGVKVRPNSICHWTISGDSITLECDVRCGTRGVVLKERLLHVATVVRDIYEGNVYLAHRDFCRLMADDLGIFAKEPIYGFNNWYYAYGISDKEQIIADARYLSGLCEGLENRPYLVIDDCWQPKTCRGPWIPNEKFGDMTELVNAIKSYDLKAGIWVRFLKNEDESITPNMRFDVSHRTAFEELDAYDDTKDMDLLDPSVPETLEYIRQDIRRIKSWGFTLIKHDFTTYDIFGRFGRSMSTKITSGDWSFRDHHHTTAEIILNMYRVIKDEAGEDTIIIGCNTIGHLLVGYAECSRIGDDTSGINFARTRDFGVNTLAYRLAQNGIFFDADADCVGVIPGNISWRNNSQWMHLLAHSGTPLFVSVKAGDLDDNEYQAVKDAFAINSEQMDILEPLDWLDTKTPTKWKINGEKVEYDWTIVKD